MAKPKRDDTELQQCIPHLQYLAAQIRELRPILFNGSKHTQEVRNACIESCLLSLRIIDEFFNDRGERDDDFKARQFDRLTGYKRILSDSEKADIDKYLAHLTTRRKVAKDWGTLLETKIPLALAEVGKLMNQVSAA